MIGLVVAQGDAQRVGARNRHQRARDGLCQTATATIRYDGLCQTVTLQPRCARSDPQSDGARLRHTHALKRAGARFEACEPLWHRYVSHTGSREGWDGTEHRYVSHIQVAGRDGTEHGGQQAYSYSSHMLHTTIIVD